METLKDKELTLKFVDNNGLVLFNNSSYVELDVKQKLNDFYEEYWNESYTGDKFKKHITCDELDYLMDKHFGSLVKIETLQDLENQEK
jgi:hypothetical protein